MAGFLFRISMPQQFNQRLARSFHSMKQACKAGNSGWGRVGEAAEARSTMQRPGEGWTVNSASYCEESSSRGGATASRG